MKRIRLKEYEKFATAGLTDQEALQLNACPGISVGMGLAPGEHIISASSYVGTTGTDDIQVIIRPKVTITRLLEMLIAAETPPWDDDAVALAEDSDPIDALVGVFVSTTEHAFLKGILQGYQSVEDSTTVLRGRVRMGAQIARHQGRVQPLEVIYDDYTENIPENQIIATAVRKLLRLRSLTHNHRRRLQRIGDRLRNVSTFTNGSRIPPIVFTRLNLRYRLPIKIALLVIRNDAVLLDEGDRLATSFLVKMHRLFEDYVGKVLEDSCPSATRVQLQYRTTLDVSGDIDIRPDLIWKRGGVPVAVADLKYKAIDISGFPNADVYQAFAYATALGLGSAHLVYAKGNQTPVVHEIRNAGITIAIHAIDLNVPLHELSTSIQMLGESIVLESRPALMPA